MSTRGAARLTRRGRLVVSLAVATVVAVGGAWTMLGRGGADLGAGPHEPPNDTGSHASQEPETVATAGTAPVAAPLALMEAETGHPALGDDPGGAVVAVLAATVARAPVVVVADPAVLGPARGVAWRVDAPLVPAGTDGLGDLLDRLGTQVVVSVRAADDPAGGTAAPSEDPDGASFGAREVRVVTVDGTTVDRQAVDDLGAAPDPEGAPAVLLVRDGDPARGLMDVVAMATGARIVPVAGALAEDTAALAALRVTGEMPWLVAGTARAWDDTDLDLLARDVEVARAGHHLPGGGLRLFPGRRMVALYGSPGTPSLGVLGEQSVAEAVERARALAADYAALVPEPVVPTFEIIATVASGGAEPTGDYSRRVPLELIEPWVDAAEHAGMYVILDLQPGRTDFLTQARELESLLVRPHVGLALDPEWRIGPGQVHLSRIGSVQVEEVQAVADWLAELTRDEVLPQKLLLLHQFTMSMLPDRARLRVPPELAVAIQMDGQGSQGAKEETWARITSDDPPAGVWFGWKNFHDEDLTLRSPADTIAVEPSPVLVSYQ